MTDDREWLQPDGRGCFASGTVDGIRTRRYHALLMATRTPPEGRMVLVNGIEAWLEIAGEVVPVTSQRYAPDVVHPDARRRIRGFSSEPSPTWTIDLGALGGVPWRLQHAIAVDRDSGETRLRWRLLDRPADGDALVRLHVRPLLSVRDYHSLHHENGQFVFEPHIRRECISFRPYAESPGVQIVSEGVYRHEPLWYRNFLYTAERDRGLDDTEDLASPGVFAFDLASGDATMVLRSNATRPALSVATFVAPVGSLAQAADAYLFSSKTAPGLIAGYPWFTEWGRDTFIALRGLLLATGRVDLARALLLAWAARISDGMLPNRLTDDGLVEYNTVDASLWFVVCVHECLGVPGTPPADAEALKAAVSEIVAWHVKGTRWGIGIDPADLLLRAGEPNSQLTWMDARVDGRSITPRVGKPVEIQALWYNALHIASVWEPGRGPMADQVAASFARRFLDPDHGGLHDVVDVDHVPGRVDPAIRPNQIFAVGGLPFPLLTGVAAQGVVACVERHLLTPYGLRTLAPGDPRYVPRYEGAPHQRDGAYHQGTVWPWLIGAFVDAWLAAHGRTPAAKAEAMARYLQTLLAHRNATGLGHVSEVFDGDAPHRPGGCPFQAWSLGELIRAVALCDF